MTTPNTEAALPTANGSGFPEHHVRYARAWELRRDGELTSESAKILEDEMDNAQNLFSFDEFQVFKQTLPGFVDFWSKLWDQIPRSKNN